MSEKRIIATIRKNAHEEIRVGFEEYHGQDIVSIRLWFEAKDGSMRPSNKGLNLKITLLPELASALRKAVNAAQAERLIAAKPPYSKSRESTGCAVAP